MPEGKSNTWSKDELTQTAYVYAYGVEERERTPVMH